MQCDLPTNQRYQRIHSGYELNCSYAHSFTKQILPQFLGQFIPGLDDGGVSYVWIPWYKGGSDTDTYVEFEVEACTDTEITIAAEVIAPTGNDDSFILTMDNGPKVVWHVGSRTGNEWTWKTLRTPFQITEGTHRLRVLHREVSVSVSLRSDCYSFFRLSTHLYVISYQASFTKSTENKSMK